MNNHIDLAALGTLFPALAGTPAAVPVPTRTALAAVPIPGVAPNCYGLEISDDEYHGSCPGASSSSLKKLLRSPAHYQAYLNEVDTDSADRKFGRAVHALLLEPATFQARFAVWCEGRRAGWKYEEFCEEHPGKTILKEEEHQRAMEAALSLRNSPDFPFGVWLDGLPPTATHEAVPAARCEFTIVWIDEETGVQCKARIDAHSPMPQPLATDVKTTDDARKSSFRRQFMKLDYDLQCAHYRAALKAFYGFDFPFLFPVVEAKAPHATGIFGMTDAMLENGEAKRRYALARLARCSEDGIWPAYQDGGIQTLDVPFMGRFDPNAV
jgi:hypothetical protein